MTQLHMKKLNQFSVLTDFWTTLTSNFSPFEETYIPTPSFMSYSNWPVKEAPEHHLYTPLPCFLSAMYSPLYT